MRCDTEIDVRNPSGLHARPAAVFVKAAAGFSATIRAGNVTTNSPEANAKSILAVLGLGVSAGHRLRIVADGDDAAQAVETLAGLVEAGLGEAVGTGLPADDAAGDVPDDALDGGQDGDRDAG